MLYNIHQQVFALSMAANILGPITGTQSYLQNYMEVNLPLTLSEFNVTGWKTIWGPVVWKNDTNNATTGADNTWYVSNSPNLVFPDGKTYDTYVIAIAGTEGKFPTSFDWEVEDAGVSKVVDFKQFAASGMKVVPPPVTNPGIGAFIANGTAVGVSVLAVASPPSSAVSPNIQLGDLITSLPSNAKVIFTGHSLAGALSPTLALGFQLAGTLKKFAPGNVLTYPTAGPTPGNGGFASLFATYFPAIPGTAYQTWNTNTINKYDLVPQAWCTDATACPAQNMHNIVPMFSPAGLLKLELDLALDAAMHTANQSNITYIPLPSNAFAGPTPTHVTNRTEFYNETMLQHVDAYFNYFNLPIPFKVATVHSPAFAANPELGARTWGVLESIAKLLRRQ